MISATSTNTVLDELLIILCHDLQITAEQHAAAEVRYQGIDALLQRRSSPLSGHGLSLYPQGSLSLGTTVKPRGRHEFDLDLVCELKTDAAVFPYPPVLIGGIA